MKAAIGRWESSVDQKRVHCDPCIHVGTLHESALNIYTETRVCAGERARLIMCPCVRAFKANAQKRWGMGKAHTSGDTITN